MEGQRTLEIRELPVAGRSAIALHVQMPGDDAHLLVIRADLGFIMCGYLNIDLADQVGDAAAMVRGVKSIDDVLASQVVAVTAKALALGITPGMGARQALMKLMDS